MLKKVVLIFFLLFSLSLPAWGQDPSLSDSRPLKMGPVIPLNSAVGRYERIEFMVDLQATFSNPFDPREIDVMGHFTSPSGKRVSLPAFYFQDYERKLAWGREVFKPKGKAQWRLRFCPVEVGDYSLKIKVLDGKGKSVESPVVKFKVLPSSSPGFIRVHSGDRRYFAFDSGKTYIPLGANVCWSGPKGTYDYDQWLPQYGSAGATFFRIWLGPSWTTFALERHSLGKFSQISSYRIDYVLDLARKEGLYVMLCFDSYNELRYKAEQAWPYWDQTPHNKANGGPLERPVEFWTNPVMRRLYQNKLRYLVARWGADTHVMAWEFWNEVDLVSPFAFHPGQVKEWHRDMSRHLRKLDPYKHLHSTSFAWSPGRPYIDQLKEIDFVQTHQYGASDMAKNLVKWQGEKSRYGKPHIIGEFGASSLGKDREVDPTGICFHNGLWAPLLSGSAGGGMLWWWDNHIHPHNLYYHLKGLSSFIKGVDFGRENFHPLSSYSFWFKKSPHLNLYGLRGKGVTLLWIQNPLHTWELAGKGKRAPRADPGAELLLPGFSGKYRVIHWDTYQGKALKTQVLEARKEGLRIELPPISRDIGLRIEGIKKE